MREMVLGTKDLWQRSLGLDIKPIATPPLQHVLIYDVAIPTKVIELMNEGVDLETALRTSQND